jgi:hypothetical protein
MKRLFATALLATGLCAAALPLSAEGVPTDTLSWTADIAANPTPAGIAGRVQVWFLADLEEESGKQLYWSLRGRVQKTYDTKYQILHFFVAANGDPPQKAESEVEWWAKARDQSSSLVRAFAGDSIGAVVIVDGKGKITRVARLSSNNEAEWKTGDSLYPTATPLIEDESLFPLGCKKALKWIKLGDVKRATKEIPKLGADGPAMAKGMSEGANKMIEADTQIIAGGASSPADRMLAIERVQAVMAEFPGAKAAKAASDAIKQVSKDKALQTEQAAYGMLQDYFRAMRKVSVKKIKGVQMEWLPGITAKFGGTYAAEVATMIRTASKLDEEK